MSRSPTPRLLVALAITLAAVAVFSWFSLRQIDRLRQLQTNTIDRHRKDSLQLLRIQNALHSLGLAIRDMMEADGRYPLTAWRSELQRTRGDLEDALRIESALATRPAEQQQYLANSMAQFWRSVDEVLDLAARGEEARARRIIGNSVQAQQAALSVTVARLLVQNNESEEQAAAAIQAIYGEVERNVYLLLAAVLAGIAATSLAVILTNRRLFNRLADLSEQRSTLARQLIEVQENVLRSVSRELHDDFGQVLTAVCAMLNRAEKKGLPADSPLRMELAEVREVVGQTLEKVRSLSQALHPTVLDDYGLEKAIERFIPLFEKQTGIAVRYEKSGEGEVPDGAAIHVYRITQEALNNVARHSGAKEATVRMQLSQARLHVEVEDHGAGMPAGATHGGLGLIAMRERAELLRGRLTLQRPHGGGTLVMLEVPLDRS
ncbi:MAG TPA: sensor histidine kinase [Bryobacteraceae bacterium]|nr:sensor histidine kinase [Bryobacteraceae bacterium]